ncbi:hypothetical protein LZ656_17515 [Leclercia adecarboxylata]|uniref:hypothetical protein n=1 Tax=Leclercia adecarboxylata TaxID=83655 RepID=UPI000980D123|nr:hypothetical protein [Leclercia adecarboxylata]MCE9984173.1 hypothetical protein [Leclercia adecarboxylata]OOB84563.1 hypothetical protein BZY71_24120 [Leclercia adecarboxylata]
MKAQQWFDYSGKEVFACSVGNIDEKTGTGEYTFRQLCTYCRGKGVYRQYYSSKCSNCNGTGYSLESKRTAYTLHALFIKNRPAATGIYKRQKEAERSKEVTASLTRQTDFTIWRARNERVVAGIASLAAKNSFMASLNGQLEMHKMLSPRQLEVAAKIINQQQGQALAD